MPNRKLTKRHFLKKNNLVDSYVFIGQYHQYNADLRGVIIQTLVEKYNNISDKKDVKDEAKHKLLSELELEIMCKVMELTESLASICYALTGDETKIKEFIVDFRVENANKFYKNIRKDNAFYYKLFTYPDIKKLPLSPQEKRFLKRLYFCNIETVKELLQIVRKFRKFNTITYNKNRHSRPMLIGFETKEKDYYAFTSIISRRKTKSKRIVNTFHLHGKPILDKYVDLARTIIILQKDLLWNRIHYFECDGFKIPLQARYIQLSDESEEIIEKINNKCKEQVVRKNINVDFTMRIKRKHLKKRLDFYANEFQTTRKGIDNNLERYGKEIMASS